MIKRDRDRERKTEIDRVIKGGREGETDRERENEKEREKKNPQNIAKVILSMFDWQSLK